MSFSSANRANLLESLQKNPSYSARVLIVGGGVVGAGLAREFSLGGAQGVLLIEKNDFASGTSGASSKLIHAGIRYLEQSWEQLKKFRLWEAHKRFWFVWAASRERKILRRIAPKLVIPEEIFFVIGKGDGRSPLSVLFGVWVYYLIQLAQGQFFPPPRFALRRKTIQANFSDLDAENVRAVFSFWDSQTDDAALTISALRYGAENGVSCLNYVELLNARRQGGKWKATLKDNQSGKEFEIETDWIINATGPFLDETGRRLGGGEKRTIDRVAGGHIDLYPAPVSKSFYVTASDGRLVFVLRREEEEEVYVRIGTTERPLRDDESSNNPELTEGEEVYLENLVHLFFPNVSISEKTVLKKDEGIRPLSAQDKDSAFSKSREHQLHWGDHLLHVAGVKLTDFRRVSEEILAHSVFANLASNTKVKSRRTPLPVFDRQGKTEEEIKKEIYENSMVVTEEDYFLRRRGAIPSIQRKKDLS